MNAYCYSLEASLLRHRSHVPVHSNYVVPLQEINRILLHTAKISRVRTQTRFRRK